VKGFLHTEKHVSVRLRTTFGRSKDNIGRVGSVTKLQAAKSEEFFDFRQWQNFFYFIKVPEQFWRAFRLVSSW
jgi:hypothetical protein